MSYLFIYNSRHSESTLVGEESLPQKSQVILRCAKKDGSSLNDTFLCVSPHLPTGKAGLMRNLFYIEIPAYAGMTILFIVILNPDLSG